ncbi:MAG: chorismate-binding protein [Bdellovibrionota bacterium]
MKIEKLSGPEFDTTSPWDVLSRLDASDPILFLGGDKSDHSLLALSFDEEDRDEFMFDDVAPPLPPSSQPSLPMTLGQVALLTYDAYNPWCGQASAPSRFFRIKKALVWNKAGNEYFLCTDDDADNAKYQVRWPLKAAEPTPPLAPLSIDWKSTWTDSQYLEAVRQSLEDIRDGRFYQINLLRFWQHQGEIPRPYFLRRLRKFAGPFAAYFDLPDLGLVSWSPERFVKVRQESGRALIEAEPIKGTRPVAGEASQDAALAIELQSSAKDNAELHMIVDLMRSDLQKLCVPGGVKVLDRGTVKSFPSVHHLIARIEGELKTGRKLEEICRALCPGGSITGAPKREVMQVIHEREERERGYFMGNVWYKDACSGRIDSSILIRTAVRQSGVSWEYAAGSGITVKSHAYEELQEVLTKARIILENPW